MHNDAPRNGLWFDPRSLEKQSDSGAWSRGLALYRSNKVLDMTIQPAGDHWVVAGEVQGSLRAPYELCIDMALAADGKLAYWDSDCDCPVGDNCKHGVAMMLKASYQGLSRLNRTHPFKEDTFILDFVNDRDEIQEAFKTYYEGAEIGEEVDPSRMSEIDRRFLR